MLTTHAKGLLITACGVLVISPDGLLSRLIETDHWTLTFWRTLFLSFGMWLIISFRHPNRVWEQYRTVRGVGLYMVFGYSIGSIAFIYALTHTSVANTLIIMSTTPLFAALIGWFLMKEKIGLRTLVAILLVGCGITVIAIGSSGGSGTAETSLTGDLVALIGSFSLAFGFSFVRRYPEVSAFSAVSCSGILTAVIMLPFAAPFSISPADLGYLMIMGIYMLPVGMALMLLGPRYIPAAEVALLVLLESILGPVWVWWMLDEVPGPHTLAGGAIVLGTLAINTIWGLKATRESPPLAAS